MDASTLNAITDILQSIALLGLAISIFIHVRGHR